MNKSDKWILNLAIWLSLLYGAFIGYIYTKSLYNTILIEELKKQEVVMSEAMLASYRQGYMDCKSGKEMR